MKIRPSSLVLVFLAIFVASSNPVTASAKKSKAVPPTDPRILVKTVNVPAGTVQIKYMRDAKQPISVYTVDGLTDVEVNNNRSTLDHIKPGMQVRDLVERDSHTLDKISVSMADPAPSSSVK